MAETLSLNNISIKIKRMLGGRVGTSEGKAIHVEMEKHVW